MRKKLRLPAEKQPLNVTTVVGKNAVRKMQIVASENKQPENVVFEKCVAVKVLRANFPKPVRCSLRVPWINAKPNFVVVEAISRVSKSWTTSTPDEIEPHAHGLRFSTNIVPPIIFCRSRPKNCRLFV